MPPSEFAERWASLEDPQERAEALRSRFRFDRAGFARWVWPERFSLAFNACHLELLEDDRPRYDARETSRDATAAPRGLGKSTLASFVDPIHAIVYDLEACIVVMTATSSLATELVDDIRAAFAEAERDESPLHALYGPFVVEGGKTDFTVSVRGRKSIRVVARSFGQQIRGIKHRGNRPTLVIVDDGERSDRVQSAEQRAKTWKYLNDDVLKAGRREGGTAFRMRGTVLHQDSMLAATLKSAGWTGRKWQALTTWPERMDLWHEAGRLWSDLTLGAERETKARAFYEANKAEMNRGAEVLDPAAAPLWKLWTIIWAEGWSSFLRELQNEPKAPGSSLFDSTRFARCRIEGTTPGSMVIVTAEGRRVPLRECRVGVRLDPIPGKELGALGDEQGSGAGDFAAIATLAKDRHGYAYVLDVWMRRGRDSEILAALWDRVETFGAGRVSIESNGFARYFGRDFRRQQAERRAAGKVWQVGIDEDVSTDSKENRIASLEVPATNGWLQFSDRIRPEVLGQFDDFPTGDHDDAPDAVEGAYRLLGGGPRDIAGTTRLTP